MILTVIKRRKVDLVTKTNCTLLGRKGTSPSSFSCAVLAGHHRSVLQSSHTWDMSGLIQHFAFMWLFKMKTGNFFF